jgi:hypothetical protein
MCTYVHWFGSRFCVCFVKSPAHPSGCVSMWQWKAGVFLTASSVHLNMRGSADVDPYVKRSGLLQVQFFVCLGKRVWGSFLALQKPWRIFSYFEPYKSWDSCATYLGTGRWSMFGKKGDFFQLISKNSLCSEERFCRPRYIVLKN